MRWFYSKSYDYGTGLPGTPREVHGFVLCKPSEIRAALIDTGAADTGAFEEPDAVTDDDLRLVHDGRVIERLRDPRAVAAAIELDEAALMPADVVWQAIVRPQLAAAGGTILALRAAAQGDWAINLSGGYHHARRDLSHGFCLINDVALAVAKLRRDGIRRRILVFDLDLHQGDGNATQFAGDGEVFTVSVHEQDLFPVPKAHSDLDVGLRSYMEDSEYLAAVDDAIRSVRDLFQPEMIVYIAGSDLYREDPLGTLQIRPAMLERDRKVARFARDVGCPLVALPAGGYTSRSPSITAAGFGAIAEIGGRASA